MFKTVQRVVAQLPGMILGAFLLVGGLLAVALPAPEMAHAQTLEQPQAPQAPQAVEQVDMIHFATQYTQAVIAGVAAGGIFANLWVGGSTATLVGALAGSVLASWLFIDQVATNYVLQRTPDKHLHSL